MSVPGREFAWDNRLITFLRDDLLRNSEGSKMFCPIRGDFPLVLDQVQKASWKIKHIFLFFRCKCWIDFTCISISSCLSRRYPVLRENIQSSKSCYLKQEAQIVEEMCGFICRWFALGLLLGESCWCFLNLLFPEKYFFLKSTEETCPERVWWVLHLSIFIIRCFVDAVCMWSCLLV